MRFRAGARLDPSQVRDLRAMTGKGIFRPHDMMSPWGGRDQVYEPRHPWDVHLGPRREFWVRPRAGYPTRPINVKGFPPQPTPEMVRRMEIESDRIIARRIQKRHMEWAGRQLGGGKLRKPYWEDNPEFDPFRGRKRERPRKR